MIYLLETDFAQLVNDDDLDVLVDGVATRTAKAELDAISEVSSYLTSQYDTDAIFDPDQADEAKSEMIKRIVLDLAIYHLHSSVNPRNIPEFRIQRRDDAIAWLKAVANPRSNVTAGFLPRRDHGDKKGTDISWGSKPKRQNYY